MCFCFWDMVRLVCRDSVTRVFLHSAWEGVVLFHQRLDTIGPDVALATLVPAWDARPVLGFREFSESCCTSMCLLFRIQIVPRLPLCVATSPPCCLLFIACIVINSVAGMQVRRTVTDGLAGIGTACYISSTNQIPYISMSIQTLIIDLQEPLRGDKPRPIDIKVASFGS